MKPREKQKTKKYIGIGIAIAVAVVVVSVLFIGINSKSDLRSTAPESASVETLQVSSVGPDFSLVDPEKGSISKQTFEGKPLFIFFTTTWCTPCQIGAQNLARYDDETGGQAFSVLIVFVDERESNSQFIEWKNKFGRDDWYIAKGIDMAQTYKIRYLDTKYVFDKNGIIRWIDVKPLEYASIEPVMRPLLGA